MSMSAILIISLAAGVVLVVGGGLLMYMSNLVRNAYELKVQINADIEERLKIISEDIDTKAKWIKRDLTDEMEKIKNNMTQVNSRSLQEMVDPLNKRMESIETMLKSERGEVVRQVEEARVGANALETKLVQFRRDIRRIEEKLGLAPSSAASAAPAAAPDPTAAPLPDEKPAPAAPKVPPGTTAKVEAVLPELK